MNPSIRVLLVVLLAFPSGVYGSPDAPASGDADPAPADPASAVVSRRLQGVGNLTVDRLPQLYGERPVGDPGAVTAAPLGPHASANPGDVAAAPAAQLPLAFKRDAAPPPEAASAAADSGPGLLGTIANFFSSSPPPPPVRNVDNPAFTQTCPPGDKDCVSVVTFTENAPDGTKKNVPLTDFVDYGVANFKGSPATQLWDSKPWWKIWQDPRQVSPNDIHQGALSDCFLLASLAAISAKEPYVLRDMIKQQKGTPSVWIRFFEAAGKPVMVGPLDDKFPVYTNAPGAPSPPGTAAFAAPSGKDGALWPLYIEKAYTLKFREKSYANIDSGGSAGDALTQITGQPTKDSYLADQPVSFEDLAKADQNSQPITMLTKHLDKDKKCPDAPATSSAAAAGVDPICSDPLYMGAKACEPGSADPVCKDPSKIVKLNMWHVYWVKSVDVGAKTVTLANPWGANRPTVTWPWARLQNSLLYAFINEKAPEK
jgi:hypothetical protein